MLGLIRRSLSDIFFPSPIKLDHSPNNLPDEFRDLDFDIYEYDEKYDSRYNSKYNTLNKNQSSVTNLLNFDSYDWAFSFRESAKSEQKVVLEVSVERIPKEPFVSSYETCCLPVSPSLSPTHTGSMTLLHGGSTASAPRTPTFTETEELISEEEQNLIMAAIIASQCDDFDRQIPHHIRDEMEYAEMVAAMEESKELARAAEQRSSAPPTPAPAPVVLTPPETPMRSSTFTTSAPSRGFRTPSTSTTMSSPRGLKRSKTDIPWTSSRGEQVEGESEKQARFRELLQFHAVAAASIANASARTGVSNITGNEDATDYDWLG